LKYINSNYTHFRERTILDYGSENMSILDGEEDTNEFQEKLINKIG
jgi:hypothetical protein